MSRIILHIDFDSFFASVEQQNNSQFRNKPLGVTASNGRTAIIAASREAKAKGVKSPSRTFDALRICPDIQFTGAHFQEYFRISKKFVAICTRFSPFVEVFSMDELFLDVTTTAKLFGGVDSLIHLIKSSIAKEIGEYITVSVGVSYNRSLAKLGSGMRKPNGVFHIAPETLETAYKEAELQDICGIGSRIEKRLNTMGVYHLLQLRNVNLEQLEAEFGPSEAHFLYGVAWGEDDTPVKHYGNAPEAKSVGRNYALPHNEYNQRIVLQNIFELCEEVSIKLRKLGKKAKIMGLSLRGLNSMYGNIHLPIYSDSGKDLFYGCLRLYRQWEWEQQQNPYVRQISVWASRLSSSQAVPLSLFDNPRSEKLQQTIDVLNKKFGDHTIRNGFLLYGAKLTTVPNGFGADRLEKKELALQEQAFVKEAKNPGHQRQRQVYQPDP